MLTTLEQRWTALIAMAPPSLSKQAGVQPTLGTPEVVAADQSCLSATSRTAPVLLAAATATLLLVAFLAGGSNGAPHLWWKALSSAAQQFSTAGTAGWGSLVHTDPVPSLISSSLEHWASPDGQSTSFQAPQSKCTLDHTGRVWLPPGWKASGGIPFVINFQKMPLPDGQEDLRCRAGVPNYDDTLYLPKCMPCTTMLIPTRCQSLTQGSKRSTQVWQQLGETGYQLQAFSPCELFARIRGRTLWFVGDSQTTHAYLAAECFLREFALAPQRSTPLPGEPQEAELEFSSPNIKFTQGPACLELVLGTRVCHLRVNSAVELVERVLPVLQRHVADFSADLLLFNMGLHYHKNEWANLVQDLATVAEYRQQHAAALPKMIWADTPVQHFDTPDGDYEGVSNAKRTKCRPLAQWYRGDPIVMMGGWRSLVTQQLLPQLADAHLRTWNASVPFWHTHRDTGDCTHWCHPSVYQLWTHLLNNLLREERLGNAVLLPAGAAAVLAGEAAAVAAAIEVAARSGVVPEPS